MQAPEELTAAIDALVPSLLEGLDVLGQAGRHLHPPRLPQLADEIAVFGDQLAGAIADAESLAAGLTGEEERAVIGQVLEAASLAARAFAGIAAAVLDDNPTIAAYRSLGHATRAGAALYPLTHLLPEVSRWFLDPELPADAADELVERLAAGQLVQDGKRGVLHAANDREQRGGFSLYVPETYDGSPLPLVIAMHGGMGHGRSFLWSWVRAARTAGAIVLSPTSVGDTWGLMQPEPDLTNLDSMLRFVAERWAVDAERVLLTGMSDGGTFSYVAGLQPPFAQLAPTHLAPCAASFHPMLLGFADAERLAGLPIYLVHGALDWMFPIDVARTADETLRAVGAAVTYREIPDLSHTYPAEENPKMLRWLQG